MQERASLPSPSTRVLLSLGIPIVGAVLVASLVALLLGSPSTAGPSGRSGTALVLAGIGLFSWLLGLRWYGLPGLGLRGHRPLYAGIGFATLGWIVFFLARFLVESEPVVVDGEPVLGDPDFGRAFLFILLFEAFCSQLWAFGLVFRSLADWRGPLTAAVTSGILFGAVAAQFFDEAFVSNTSSLLYFMVWGIFYGLIRLRTGSLLGAVIVQAMQSLTAWHILLPPTPPDVSGLQNLYLVSSIFYIIFIWRLWPKEEVDYRV